MAEKAIKSVYTGSNASAQSCENCQAEEANGYCNQCQIFIGPNCIEVHKRWGAFASHEIYNVLNNAQEASVSPVARQPIQYSTRDQALADVAEKSLSIVASTQETSKQKKSGPVEQESVTLRELDSCPQKSLDTKQQFKEFNQLVCVRGKGLVTAMAGHKASFDLHITEVTGTPLSPNILSCQLIPTIDSPVIQCDARQMSDDQFEVTYCSPNVGLHQLLVKVGGAEILGSPFTVHVLPSPEMRRNPIKTFKGVYYPHSVAITKEGNLVITEVDPKSFGRGRLNHGETSRIIILDPDSDMEIRRIGKWGTGEQEFRNPFGVDVTQDGHIVVIDSNNYRVKLLTEEGKVVSSVGSSGSKPLQFLVTMGVAVHPNGQIFISDTFNYHVQVLNADLTFSHCFGSKGTGVGEFKKPTGIAIDSKGMVYVVDQVWRHVKKFTPEGMYIAAIGERGREEGQFRFPEGICINANDVMYVYTDYTSKTVTMFSTEGAFLGHVGNSDGSSFSFPRRVAVDTSRRLYITQPRRVVVY